MRSLSRYMPFVGLLIFSCEQAPEPDTEPPVINITYPLDEAEITDSVRVRAAAADNDAVENVSFLVDGITLGDDSVEPYEIMWFTDDWADGEQHSLLGIAEDKSGNIGQSDLVTVTVLIPVPSLLSLTIHPSDTTVEIGEFVQYQAVGLFDDASSQIVTTSVDWESSNAPIVSISKAGMAYANAAGAAAISAIDPHSAIEGTASIEVPEPLPELESITVYPADTTVYVGATATFRAVGTYDDASRSDTISIQWSTSDNSIATIDHFGVVTAITLGSVTVTASSVNSSVYGSASLSVQPEEVTIYEVLYLVTVVGDSASVVYEDQNGQTQIETMLIPGYAKEWSTTFQANEGTILILQARSFGEDWGPNGENSTSSQVSIYVDGKLVAYDRVSRPDGECYYYDFDTLVLCTAMAIYTL
ncbi:Ig-like domain-containing protein [Candidatus Neomarinimicrobiota bacterium]